MRRQCRSLSCFQAESRTSSVSSLPSELSGRPAVSSRARPTEPEASATTPSSAGTRTPPARATVAARASRSIRRFIEPIGPSPVGRR